MTVTQEEGNSSNKRMNRKKGPKNNGALVRKKMRQLRRRKRGWDNKSYEHEIAKAKHKQKTSIESDFVAI